jgi:hypothetical protein
VRNKSFQNTPENYSLEFNFPIAFALAANNFPSLGGDGWRKIFSELQN